MAVVNACKMPFQDLLTGPVLLRDPSARQFSFLTHVQQQQHSGLSSDPHSALCTPETHHSPESCCWAPGDREPRPYSKSVYCLFLYR